MTLILETENNDCETICVRGRSSDATLRRVKDWQHEKPQTHVVNLSSNSGKESALAAALGHNTGDVVIPMDRDLQNWPKMITK